MNCPNCGTEMERMEANVFECGTPRSTDAHYTTLVGTISVYECDRCDASWEYQPGRRGLKSRVAIEAGGEQ